MYRRPHFIELIKRLKEARNFMQVLAGPRQTGKTTLIHVLEKGGRKVAIEVKSGEPPK
jgi:predicted AAA+ superfamily ATPase